MKHYIIGLFLGLSLGFAWINLCMWIFNGKPDTWMIWSTLVTFSVLGSVLFHWWKN